MTTISAMLFDLDGTLLDSAPDLVASLNHVRKSENLAPLEVDPYRRYVSHGAVGLLKAGMPEADPGRFESWRLGFLEHYAENTFCHSELYDGVEELLDELMEAGIPWGIVTNKAEKFTLPIVEAAGLKTRCGCVVGGDTLSVSKPDPAPVLLACERLGSLPRNTLFVGDDIRDFQAGQAAGTPTAAVHYGYGSFDPNETWVRDCVQVHHPSDLVRLIHQPVTSQRA